MLLEVHCPPLPATVTSIFVRSIPVILLIILKMKLALKSDRKILPLPNIIIKSLTDIEANKFKKIYN